MKNVGQRLTKDLKADPKKSVFMLSLAVIFIFLCWTRFGGDDKNLLRAPEPVDATSVTLESTSRVPGEEVEKLTFPEFLNSAMPFEQIGQNPFETSFFSGLEIAETAAVLKDPSAMNLHLPMEKELVESFEVTCTLTGGSMIYAIVDGQILKVGDEYRKFTLNEIGDGFVVFEGTQGLHRADVRF